MPEACQLAYLTSRYPAVSHTFIQQEVLGLRQAGFHIRTFGLRRSESADALTPADREESARTYGLRPVSPYRLAAAHLWGIRQNPRGYLRALRTGYRLGRGFRRLLKQLLYFGQAVPLWEAMARSGACHVHAHFESPAADVALLIAELGHSTGPWTWSFTAHKPQGYMDDPWLLAEKVRRARLVVCISEDGRSRIESLVDPGDDINVEIVRCGIDPARFRVDRTQGQPGKDDSVMRVLCVARLSPEKAHGDLLRAIALAREASIDVRLSLVGDGPMRRALEALARDLGVAEHTEFLGSVGQDHIRECYAAADVFCLASTQEGVPVVLMEAMASGLPIIATSVGGVPEIVDDGVSGKLVPPNAPHALANALKSLAERREEWPAMGRAGAEKVVREFSSEQNLHALAALFRTQLARNRAQQQELATTLSP